MFQTLLDDRRAKTQAAAQRYVTGLDKLASSAEQVAGMQTELTEL